MTRFGQKAFSAFSSSARFLVVPLLLLLLCCACAAQKPTGESILNVNGTLYYGTPETGPMGDCDCVTGQILGTVDRGETPAESGWSNFGGVGSNYAADGDDIAMVQLDGEWYIFRTKTD